MKLCEHCGRQIIRAANRSPKQWEAQRYCSHQCRYAGQRHPRSKCGCGCGREVRKAGQKFVAGHVRKRSKIFYQQADGRWFIRDRQRRVRLWYRVVMEDQLGRLLRSDEVVHHINHDPTDDRPENLELMTWGEHSRHHRYHEMQEVLDAAA